MTPARRLIGELLGTALLLAAVVGSGIMGERLSGGNVTLELPAGKIVLMMVARRGVLLSMSTSDWMKISIPQAAL